MFGLGFIYLDRELKIALPSNVLSTIETIDHNQPSQSFSVSRDVFRTIDSGLFWGDTRLDVIYSKLKLYKGLFIVVQMGVLLKTPIRLWLYLLIYSLSILISFEYS